MNLLNINGYASSVRHLEDILARIDGGNDLVCKDVPSKLDIQKYLHSCPVFMSYFVICGFRNKTFEFRGTDSFDEYEVIKKVTPGVRFFFESILENSSPRNTGQVEAMISFCQLSQFTFGALDAAISHLSIDEQSKVSRDRLYIAATALIIKNVFPNDVIEMSLPMKKMTDFHSMSLRLHESLDVAHLLNEKDVVKLYPDSLERRILKRVSGEVLTHTNMDPFQI